MVGFFHVIFPVSSYTKILIWRPYHILPFQIYTFFFLFHAMENQYRIHSTSHVPSQHTILFGIFLSSFLPHASIPLLFIFFGLSIPYTPPPQVLSCPLLFRMPLAPHSFQYTHPHPTTQFEAVLFHLRMRGIRDEVWAGLAMDDRRLYSLSPPPQRMDLLKSGKGGRAEWKSTDACHWSFPGWTSIEGGP